MDFIHIIAVVLGTILVEAALLVGLVVGFLLLTWRKEERGRKPASRAPDFVEPTYCGRCWLPIHPSRVYCNDCGRYIEQEKMKWWYQEISA